jgi:FliI/YscN family ATPase
VSAFANAFECVRRAQPLKVSGRVAALRGLTVLIDELPAPSGSLVRFTRSQDVSQPGGPLFGEVVGFSRDQAIVMVLGQTTGISPGDEVVWEQTSQTAPVGLSLLGRVVDGLGRPIDGKGPAHDRMHLPINPEPIAPLKRRPIRQALRTGLRVIDLMTPLGRGQRLGIFAGPGVGKSTLLGSIAQRTEADVNVIALIGERGREVQDFIAHSLGPKGLGRSVVVVATGDESPLLRMRAAKLACTAAEFFRDRGLDVLLMMDSVTRFAHAQRQVGLSVGEPPATKGYTPSVFAQLALLLERAGAIQVQGDKGSITGLYTILVEGDDMTEPIADAARGILDGHVILSRKLAHKGQFPAVDVLDSVSSVADDVITPEHSAARRQLCRMMAIYKDVEDLVQIGAYAKGSNPEADVAIEANRLIVDLLRQSKDDVQPFEQARGTLLKLAKDTSELAQKMIKAKSGGR